jgi:type I restriction enzyme M protein
MNHPALSSFIWSIADLLRGDYKQSEYGKVVLPFTVLRRLDCVLAGTKAAVLAEFDTKPQAGISPDAFLLRKAGQSFYNTSPLDLPNCSATRTTCARASTPTSRAFAGRACSE